MLPVITDETISSTLATLHDDAHFSKNTIKEIQENNPVLYNMLELTCSSDRDPEYIRGYITGALQFYKLLERQTQSDLMNVLWGD